MTGAGKDPSSTDDLRARLEQMPTGDLLGILRDQDLEEWRPEAFPLVEAILAARHVDVPAALESLRAAATYVDFEALATIATFSTAIEAHLCRMALEEAAIPSWLFNDNLAGVHVPLGMAIGVSVRVRPEDAAAAREMLEAVRAGAVAAPEEAAGAVLVLNSLPMPASEIAKIFQGLPKRFQKGTVKKPRTFYFSLDDDEKWTVALTPDTCEVTAGKPAADADCFFKASKQMFLDVWNGKHVPSAKDFLTGAIKSNNPLLLKDFVAAFKKA